MSDPTLTNPNPSTKNITQSKGDIGNKGNKGDIGDIGEGDIIIHAPTVGLKFLFLFLVLWVIIAVLILWYDSSTYPICDPTKILQPGDPGYDKSYPNNNSCKPPPSSWVITRDIALGGSLLLVSALSCAALYLSRKHGASLYIIVPILIGVILFVVSACIWAYYHFVIYANAELKGKDDISSKWKKTKNIAMWYVIAWFLLLMMLTCAQQPMLCLFVFSR